MKAFGFFGLALVLLAVLLVGPFVKKFTEGFSEVPPVVATPTTIVEKAQLKILDSYEKETKAMAEEILKIDNLLLSPELDSSMKEELTKKKTELQQKVNEATQKMASTVDVKEGFEGILSTDLEKNTKGTDLLQTAGSAL